MKIEKIYPDVEKTFGEIIFAKRGRDRYVRDPLTNRASNILESRGYMLTSEYQGELELQLPVAVDELVFKFKEKIKLINPVLTNYASASGNYAQVNWKLEVDLIESANKNQTMQKENIKNK